MNFEQDRTSISYLGAGSYGDVYKRTMTWMDRKGNACEIPVRYGRRRAYVAPTRLNKKNLAGRYQSIKVRARR